MKLQKLRSGRRKDFFSALHFGLYVGEAVCDSRLKEPINPIMEIKVRTLYSFSSSGYDFVPISHKSICQSDATILMNVKLPASVGICL